jgi:hypothetical protein
MDFLPLHPHIALDKSFGSNPFLFFDIFFVFEIYIYVCFLLCICYKKFINRFMFYIILNDILIYIYLYVYMYI